MQTFMWYCIVNTPVTLVTVNVTHIFENGSQKQRFVELFILVIMQDMFSSNGIFKVKLTSQIF